MSNVCDVWGKGKMKGHLVSHSNRKTNRAYKPNLQKVKFSDDNGNVVTATLCTKCLKNVK